MKKKEVENEDILKLFTIGKDQEFVFQCRTFSEVLRFSKEKVSKVTSFPQPRKKYKAYVSLINLLFKLHEIDDQFPPLKSLAAQ